MKHKSQYFKTARDLITEKDRLWGLDQTRRDTDEILRGFYNGQALSSENEAQEDDSAGLVNHLIGYRGLSSIQDGFFAVYSSTANLVQVKVDTGSPEVDNLTGTRISRILNKAIYFSGEYGNLHASVSGEICFGGRAPLLFNRKGWCPRIAPNLLLPEGASNVASRQTYAFAPYELTYSRLKDLEHSVKDGANSKFVDLPKVKLLLELLEKQIRGEGNQASTTQGRELGRAVMNDVLIPDERTVIKAWKYYEVKLNAKKEPEVSETLVTERVNLLDNDNKNEEQAVVISYIPVAFKSPEEWLHIVLVDSQIGGLKTYETAKGMAELTYGSDAHAEELLNEQIAGDMMRSRPKFTMDDKANQQQVARWNVARDSMVPQGVVPVQVHAAGNLLTSISMLAQNSSGLTGGSVSNTGRDGELRQQALERQGQNASRYSNRMSSFYTNLDRLFDEIVRRFLAMDIKPGCEGYDDIAWVRMQLDGFQIPYKKLAERKYGRFLYLEVRVNRVIGSGDRESELTVASELMAQLPNFKPEVRDLITQKWVALLTKDTSLAESLSTLPETIINQQRVIAENEFDTAQRRAAAGEVIPIGRDDIDEDHVPSHAKDLKAFLSEAQYRPFTQLDVMRIAAVIDHISAHLSRMASMPASAGAAKMWQQVMQQLIREAGPIIAKVQEQQQASLQEGQQMTPKEQADFMIRQGQLQLDAQKEGRAMAEFEEIVKSRESRENQGNRKQYASEVKTQEQLKLAKEKLELDKQKVKHEKANAKSKSGK